MKTNQILLLLTYLVGFGVLTGCQSSSDRPRRIEDFNFDWKFSLEDHEDAWKPDFTDTNWRSLRLPHDWVIENSVDSSFEFWEATGRIPGKGIGWYRKSFKSELEEDEKYYLHFDGIYNNATIWLNGQELGFHPYGYAPFYFDLSPHLNPRGSNNVIAVKVDHSRYADSRWYTGAGIYRNVELIKTYKLHIPIWGVFISTPEVSSTSAKVKLEIDLQNDFAASQEGQLKSSIFAPDGTLLSQNTRTFSIEKTGQLTQDFEIVNPLLWDTEHPNLYYATSEILLEGKIVDSYTQRFGIRDIRFDPNDGFFLNGKNTKIKGVCLHHDGGLVGSAVPKGVWRRRLSILKEAGCNAIRSAHNPASSEFLDLCDEMGFLVQDEFFDEWDNPKDKRYNMNQQSAHYETTGYGEYFHEWAERDIQNTMKSHRNHPSIIQWSIGNEIEWTYPRNQVATGFFDNMDWTGNYFWSEPPFAPVKIREMLETLPKGTYDIGQTAQQLASWARQQDTTRPITANCILPSVSHLNGYGDALDMIGYSYRRVLYDYGHKNYPNIPIMGMENVPQYHEWKAVMEHPHIAGTYLWTGIEYMGEIRAPWPARSNGSGMLDLAGFPRASYHMYKTLWNKEPHLYISTNIHDQIKYGGKPIYKVNDQLQVEEFETGAWREFVWGWQSVNEHWNYKVGDTIIAEVITNLPQVELFLNGESLGIQKRADQADNILKWAIPYEVGELKAIGKSIDQEVVTAYHTSGKAAKIKVEPDQDQIEADQYSVVHLVVQVLDESGYPSYDDQIIEFRVDDKLRLLGVDNGSNLNIQDFQSNIIKTDKGRALLIVQAKDQKGPANITISANGLPEEVIKLKLN